MKKSFFAACRESRFKSESASHIAPPLFSPLAIALIAAQSKVKQFSCEAYELSVVSCFPRFASFEYK
jgi:hypothetical protein